MADYPPFSFSDRRSYGREGYSGRFSTLLEGLRSTEDSLQLQAVIEVSELLCMSNEDSLRGFDVPKFVEALSDLLGQEHNPNLMLVAARALGNLLEASPDSAQCLVDKSLIPVLCTKLLVFEYIDLAEEALSILHKLSWEHAYDLLKAGLLHPILSYLDFFQVSVQRKGLLTVGKMCKEVGEEEVSGIVEVLPLLYATLSHSDSQMVSTGCLCFSNISERFCESKEKMEIVGSKELIYIFNSLLLSPSLSSETITLVVKTLTRFCKSSGLLTTMMLSEGVGETLIKLLESIEATAKSISSVLLGEKSPSKSSPELKQEILGLASVLLPNFPEGSVPSLISEVCLRSSKVAPPPACRHSFGRKIDYQAVPLELEGKKKKKIKPKNYGGYSSPYYTPSLPYSNKFVIPERSRNKKQEETFNEEQYERKDNNGAKKELNSPCAKQRPKKKRKNKEKIIDSEAKKQQEEDNKIVEFLSQNPDILKAFSLKMIPFLVGTYHTCVNRSMKTQMLVILTKLLYFSPKEMLEECIKDLPIANIVGDVLSKEKEENSVSFGLIQCEILLDKLPDIYLSYFNREGIVNKLFLLKDKLKDRRLSSNRGRPKKSSRSTRWIKTHTTRLLQDYFGPKDSASKELVEMKELCEALSNSTKQEGEERMEEKLKTIGELIPKLSAFEVVESALVHHLLLFLALPQTSPKSNLLQEKRVHKFMQVFCSENGKKETRLECLVKQLHNILIQEDHFSSSINSDNVLLSLNHLKLLVQPLRLTLSFVPRKDQNCRDVQLPYDSFVMEPLGTVKDIKNFIWNTIHPPHSPSSLSQQPQQIDRQYTESKRQRSDGSEQEEQKGKERIKNEEMEETLPLPSQHSHNIIFFSNSTNIPLSDSTSLFIATQSNYNSKVQGLWKCTHPFSYSFTPISNVLKKNTKQFFTEEGSTGVVEEIRKVYSNMEKPSIIDNISSLCLSVMTLLSILHKLNASNLKDCGTIPESCFHSAKLCAKVVQEASDPMSLASQNMPNWTNILVNNFPFLFPFHCRQLYLETTSFGVARSLKHLNLSEKNKQLLKLGRIERRKVRVSRQDILSSGQKVMELYAGSKAILEVAYFGEVGVGSGPTLEFYTMLSNELQKVDLDMWMSDIDPKESDYVFHPAGLFPKPINPNLVSTRKN